MSESAVPRGMFTALRVRDDRIYWGTGLASNTGTAMQGVAPDRFVLIRTHSGIAVGWTAGLQFAPVLLFGCGAGYWPDRCDRRTPLLWAQSPYAVRAGLLAVAALSGHAPLWAVYLLSFALGCVFTAENPARLSSITELVGDGAERC